MKTFVLLLTLLSRAFASASAPGSTSTDSAAVTVTVTRTFTTCPAQPTVASCDVKIPTGLQSAPGTSASSSSTSTATSLSTTASNHASSSSSSSSTTAHASSPISTPSTSTSTSSLSSTPTTTPSTTTVTFPPGSTFTPSATLTLADVNIAPSIILARQPQVSTDLTVPVTVYIDAHSNPNAAVLTLDPLQATSFTIDADTTLTTTLRSYPYVCGTSVGPQGGPGRFGCDDSGAVPQTLSGWVDSPVFVHRDWVFCYTLPDLGLYLAKGGPTADCREITFTVGGEGAVGDVA